MTLDPPPESQSAGGRVGTYAGTNLAFRRALRVFVAVTGVVTILLLARLVFAASLTKANVPEQPRLYVDTTYVAPPGRTLAVRAGGDFQAALDAAKPGDVIALEAGTTFTGPFTLPNKSGSEWIVIRSDAPASSLPPAGTRVDPAYARVMPKLVAAAGPVLSAAPAAHHYRFLGIEIRPGRTDDGEAAKSPGLLRSVARAFRGEDTTKTQNGAFLPNLVLLGARESSVEQLPHDIIFDRCYIHGDPKAGARRGIVMNSRYTAVIDSYFSDFKEVGADSQAIAGWNGPGPFKIVNNYLEGAGENLMFGGADPAIPNLVPSDIEIRGNHFAKPLSWMIGHPTYEGTPWTIKNLLELKNARRVLIDGNIFEHNWPHAQNGFAILFTVRNQDGSAPWSVVTDVTFTNNVVRHTAGGINILGRDDNHPSQRTEHILIKNNLFDDVGGAWGAGRLFQLVDGTADVVIDHNTAFQTGEIIGASGGAHGGFVYRNNVSLHNRYGVGGDGTFGDPRRTIHTYFPGAAFVKNILIGANPRDYPPDNFFPASLAKADLLVRAGRDYRLARSSRHKATATDGKAVGVDFEELCAAMPARGTGPAHFSLCSPPERESRFK